MIRLAEGTNRAGPQIPLLIHGVFLTRLCTNADQRRVLAMPSWPVLYTPGSIRGEQFTNQRLSYINAFLIQSRGQLVDRPCDECVRISQESALSMHPFPICARLPGNWRGACANCKWLDKAKLCSCRDSQLASRTRSITWAQATGRLAIMTAPAAPAALPAPASLAGSSARNPVVLDADLVDLTSEYNDGPLWDREIIEVESDSDGDWA
jgi:hypothetical protein